MGNTENQQEKQGARSFEQLRREKDAETDRRLEHEIAEEFVRGFDAYRERELKAAVERGASAGRLLNRPTDPEVLQWAADPYAG
jgi:hypothetical protein